MRDERAGAADGAMGRTLPWRESVIFGWVRAKGSAVTDASGMDDSSAVSSWGGTETTKGRGGEVKVMMAGTGLTIVASASKTRLWSCEEEREKWAR